MLGRCDAGYITPAPLPIPGGRRRVVVPNFRCISSKDHHVTFDDLRLDPRLLSGVEGMGYRTPTPVQREAIPPVLAGRDLLALAATGTGKTAAFVLPLLQRLMRGERGQVRALVLAPTRELAEQIHDHLRRLGSRTRLRSATVYGGVGLVAQGLRLRAGVEIVVACPGRLLDHMRRGNVDLAKLDVLVLDEADSLFEMGFLPDVRAILKAVPPRCQRLLFSATMPDGVRHLANDVLHDPVRISVDPVRPAATVDHMLYPVPQHLRTPLLKAILRTAVQGAVVVFVRTRHGARRLWQQLANVGVAVTCLQGKLSQRRRQAALDGFRDGRFTVLVATDVAARGLDISQVTHVINYDIPATPDAYIHRVGRTGRAEKTGAAITFVTPQDEALVRVFERTLGAPIPRERLQGFDYSVPARGLDGERATPPPRQPRLPGGRKPAYQPEAQPEPQRPARQRPARHAVPPAGQSVPHMAARHGDKPRQERDRVEATSAMCVVVAPGERAECQRGLDRKPTRRRDGAGER